MNNVQVMVRIIQENYTLGEIEERFEANTDSLSQGLDVYVEDNYDHVTQVLREDLWSMEG